MQRVVSLCYPSSDSSITRNSRPEVFCKKGVLKNLAKFTGKHLYKNVFLNKVAGLMGTPTVAVFEPQRYLLAKVMQYKSPLLVFMRAVSRGFVFTC